MLKRCIKTIKTQPVEAKPEPTQKMRGGMMKKRIIRTLVIVLTFLLLAPLSYAENDDLSDLDMGLTEPSADGIYKRDNITIKFIAPAGWKMRNNSLQDKYGHIIFTPASFETIANLNISALSASPNMAIKPEDMLEVIRQDETVLNAEAIDFADTRALCSTSLINGIKAKQIQFYQAENLFMVTFLAEEESFDRYLPAVDESLKSFEIISSTSPN